MLLLTAGQRRPSSSDPGHGGGAAGRSHAAALCGHPRQPGTGAAWCWLCLAAWCCLSVALLGWLLCCWCRGLCAAPCACQAQLQSDACVQCPPRVAPQWFVPTVPTQKNNLGRPPCRSITCCCAAPIPCSPMQQVRAYSCAAVLLVRGMQLLPLPLPDAANACRLCSRRVLCMMHACTCFRAYPLMRLYNSAFLAHLPCRRRAAAGGCPRLRRPMPGQWQAVLPLHGASRPGEGVGLGGPQANCAFMLPHAQHARLQAAWPLCFPILMVILSHELICNSI